MKIDWKKTVLIGKNIFLFFLGVIFVHILTAIIMSTPFPEMIKEMGEEGMKDFISNIGKEVFSSLIKIYIISFILFYFLTNRIKRSRWYLRGIYFIAFYAFCILVYLWI